MKCENVKVDKIHLIKVDNENGLVVYFSAMGASIYAINFNGVTMTLTPTSMKGFLDPKAYYGKTIGPICGRIKDGIIDIDGKQYTLDKNEGDNTLHGGKDGLSNTIFHARIVNTPNSFVIMFSHKRKKERKGIPTTVNYFVMYSLSKTENKIYLSHRITNDNAMVLSLTNHAYFTLGETSIHGLKLKIPASKVVEVNASDLVPERYIDIPDCLDFRKGAPITKDINNEYLMNSRTAGIDHFYLLDKVEEPVILEGHKFKLEITSNYQGLQVYSDNYADNIEMKDITARNFRGVALEPQDSPLERKTYHKGEIYDRYIEYNFIKK